MKKILLLGATGFVGKNIAEAFNTDEYTLFPISSKECNLLHLSEVQTIIKKIEPDFVINAAFRGVNSNAKFTKEYLYENLEMIINIIEACKDIKNIKKLLFIGSSLEYGDADAPISEEEQLKPKNMYATIKSMSSLLAISLAKEYHLPLVLVRAFNLYGKYGKKGIIYHVIQSILNKKELSLTKGEQIRDFLSITDLSQEIVEIIKNYTKFNNYETYNIASGIPVKMKDIFTIIFKLMDFKDEVTYIPYRKNDYFHHVANVEKLHKILQQKDILPLKEGLKQTIEWVKNDQKCNKSLR